MIVSKFETGSPIVSTALHERNFPQTLWVILLVAVISRVWGVWYGYPDIIHPDEHHIVGRALLMLQAPAYELNPHFFEYPSLYLYLTALLYLGLGVVLLLCGFIGSMPELYPYAQEQLFWFHVFGRLLTAGLGVATIYYTYLSARQLWGQAVALLSAWFLAVSYLHFTDSHFISTDVPSAFFVMWAFYLALVALQSARARKLYLAAFVAGLAASVKYPAGLVLLVVYGAGLMQCRATTEAWFKAFFPKLFLKLSLHAGFGFLLGTPYAVLDFKAFAAGLISQLLHSRLGHLGVEESGFLGYFTALTPSGGVGAMLMLAALGGLLVSLWRPQARTWLLLAFPLFFYLLLGRAALKVDRYLIPAIPFFCIYAAVFVEQVAALLRSRLAQRGILLGCTLALSALPVFYMAKWCWIVTQPDTRREAALWIDKNIAPETVIAKRVGSWMFPQLNEEGRKLKQIPVYTEESARARVALKLELLQKPATAWIMRNVFKDTVQVAELQRYLQSLPTFADWRAPTLQSLRADSVQIVVTSSLLEERFVQPTMQAKFPEMSKSWQALFISLASEGRLLQEFVPSENLRHPWGLGFLERPTIRLYALD
ncbi:MAG: glycosyltransferase family 39 protein [candidate division KSB1 bacterium]